MRMHVIFAALVVAALVGCSKGQHGDNNDAAIQLVKDLPSEQAGLTNGQVLSAKSNCSPGEWTSSKDKFQRDVVAFNCTVAVPADQLAGAERSALDDPHAMQERTADYCHLDTKKILADQTAAFDARYGRFAKLTETLEFVVNQGAVVEEHVGLTDGAGVSIPLSAAAIGVLPSRMENVNHPDVEITTLFDIARAGTPSPIYTCKELAAAGYLPAAVSSDAPTASQGTASGASEPSGSGDAEPEPKGE